MRAFYRSVFIGCAVIPGLELLAIPSRSPLKVGQADAFMLLLVCISMIGLVLTDIYAKLTVTQK